MNTHIVQKARSGAFWIADVRDERSIRQSGLFAVFRRFQSGLFARLWPSKVGLADEADLHRKSSNVCYRKKHGRLYKNNLAIISASFCATFDTPSTLLSSTLLNRPIRVFGNDFGISATV